MRRTQHGRRKHSPGLNLLFWHCTAVQLPLSLLTTTTAAASLLVHILLLLSSLLVLPLRPLRHCFLRLLLFLLALHRTVSMHFGGVQESNFGLRLLKKI